MEALAWPGSGLGLYLADTFKLCLHPPGAGLRSLFGRWRDPCEGWPGGGGGGVAVFLWKELSPRKVMGSAFPPPSEKSSEISLRDFVITHTSPG